MGEDDAKIVLALAQSNMNINAAARKLYYANTTFYWHLDKIKKITGLDPRNFFDLGELYTIAREILGDEYELL
jgi:sugar diacid utilization regulator